MLKKCLLLALVFVVALSLFACGGGAATVEEEKVQPVVEVNFPDPNLEAVIRASIKKPEGPIMSTDLTEITYLPADKKSISSISGCEYLPAAWRIYLDNNQITDLSPFENSSTLHTLRINTNPLLSDLSPLSGCQRLTRLDVSTCQVSDLSPLSGLPLLTEFSCARSPLSNLTPLSSITSLNMLYLGEDQITDISPVASLTKLVLLYINDNPLTDISPLKDHPALATLSLSGCQISDFSIISTIVSLDTLFLSGTQMTDLSVLVPLLKLNELYLERNQITDLSPLLDLPRLTKLHIEDNPLSDTSINTYIPQLEAKGVTVYTMEYTDRTPIVFPDPGLRANIRTELDQPWGDFYPQDIEEFTELSITGDWAIADLTGLDLCPYLTSLKIKNNILIEDLSPISAIKTLTDLSLAGDIISDISALAPLTNLTVLDLIINEIEDISPLANLTKLTKLNLSKNQIVNVAALSSLKELKSLDLSYNQIVDIKPLLDNTGLGEGDTIYLSNNPLSDASVNDYIPQLEAKGVKVYH